jgi:deferrochelatase/peroxidase EfeB
MRRPFAGRERSSAVTRRGLFGLGAVSAAGVAGVAVAAGGARAEGTIGGAGQLALGGADSSGGTGFSSGVVPFGGPHQAGIATPVQDRMHTAAFDLTTTDRVAVIRLLKDWTAAAARMTAGRGVGGGPIPIVAAAPPDDTGEAIGLPASRLTLTIGFGPGLFEKDGADRFGLRSQRPAALIDLPHFAGDNLDPNRCGGDIVVQACADDPQVAVHAVRNLARIGFGTVSVRWSQLGFGKTSSTTPAEQTPRNLFGFKDGTENIPGTDNTLLDRHVWVTPAEGPAWLAGGTYVVMRRIAMRIETWDRSPLTEQELIVGRTKGEGAPLSGGTAERDKVDVAKLPVDAHVALVHPSANGGVKMLRRGYSFVDGSDGLGRLDAGLFFVAFVRDARTQYVPMQSKIARGDAMSEYLVHTGSGLWAVPPGVSGDGYWGQSLLEA